MAGFLLAEMEIVPENLKQPRTRISNCSTIARGETLTWIREGVTPTMVIVAKKKIDSDVDNIRGWGRQQ